VDVRILAFALLLLLAPGCTTVAIYDATADPGSTFRPVEAVSARVVSTETRSVVEVSVRYEDQSLHPIDFEIPHVDPDVHCVIGKAYGPRGTRSSFGSTVPLRSCVSRND